MCVCVFVCECVLQLSPRAVIIVGSFYKCTVMYVVALVRDHTTRTRHTHTHDTPTAYIRTRTLDYIVRSIVQHTKG